MRGRLITLEGVEGVGKSTVVPVVKDFLLDRGVEVLHTREPVSYTHLTLPTIYSV